MNLRDDWFLERASQARRVFQMAMYAVHLATGHNLVDRMLKADTISSYLYSVAHLLQKFCKTDPRKDAPTDDKHSPHINDIIKEIKRCEQHKFDNKRNPYTPGLHRKILERLVREKPHDDSVVESLADWFALGLNAGFRNGEWAQDNTHTLENPMRSDWGKPKAFTLEDIKFRGKNFEMLTLAQAYELPYHKIGKACVRFTDQKNQNNGEERWFTPNTKSTDLCAVRALHRIFKRFIRLKGWSDLTVPLAIYLPAKGAVPKAIQSRNIEAVMQTAAKELYNLNEKLATHQHEMKRFSSHSLRVGACVILHANGFSGPQIKFLLRWKSDAFMEYLRNVGLLQEKQADAIAYSDTLPQFF